METHTHILQVGILPIEKVSFQKYLRLMYFGGDSERILVEGRVVMIIKEPTPLIRAVLLKSRLNPCVISLFDYGAGIRAASSGRGPQLPPALLLLCLPGERIVRRGNV